MPFPLCMGKYIFVQVSTIIKVVFLVIFRSNFLTVADVNENTDATNKIIMLVK